MLSFRESKCADSGSPVSAQQTDLFDRQGTRKYLNGAEQKAFLRAVDDDPDSSARAFCLTLLYTGCRISEALNMTAGRVDIRAKSLVFETMKRRKPGCFRAVPVPDSLVTLLRQLVARLQPSARVWNVSRPTAYRLIKIRMAEVGINGAMASPKGLRHGFAITCVSQDVPLTTIKKWLGHARLETTEIYLHASGDEERDLARRVWAAMTKSKKKPCQNSGQA